MSRDPHLSETVLELEPRTPDAQSGGLFLTVGYLPPFCPCLVSLHPFHHLFWRTLSICLYPTIILLEMAGSSVWWPGLFCCSLHLLIPVFSSQISPFPVFPSAQIDTWASLLSAFVHPPFFLALFLSQILWAPGRMQRSCSPWSIRPWRWGKW